MCRFQRPACWPLIALGLLTAMPVPAMVAAPQDNSSIPIAALQRNSPVDFETEVLPMFTQSCLACHNAKKAKADLVLETPQTIAAGSEYGPVIAPADADNSRLLLVAAHRDDPVMPPANNKVKAPNLTSEQLAILKLWIEQGAKGQISGRHAAMRWHSLPDHLHPVYAVAVSSDGQFVACGRGNRIFIYHIPSRQLVSQLADPNVAPVDGRSQPDSSHRDMIQALAFSPDGHLLASGGYRIVKLWHRQRHVQKLKIDTGLPKADESAEAPTWPVATSPDGRWLAIGAADQTIRIWDLVEAKQAMTLAGHTEAVQGLSFATDGGLLFSASADNTVRVWDLADGSVRATAQTDGPLGAVAPVTDAQHLATGGKDAIIRIWKLPQNPGDTLTEVHQLTGHEQAVTSLATFADGSKLVSGSADGSVRIWNVADGQQTGRLDHGGPVAAVAVRPDGLRIASGGQDNMVSLWDVESGQRLAQRQGDRYLNDRLVRAQGQAKFATELAADWVTTRQKAEKRQYDLAAALLKSEMEKTEASANLESKQHERQERQAINDTTDQLLKQVTEQIDRAQSTRDQAEASAQQAATFANSAAELTAELQEAAEQANQRAQAARNAAEKAQSELDTAKSEAQAALKAAEEALKKNPTEARSQQEAASRARAKAERLTGARERKGQLADAAEEAAKRAAEAAASEQQLAADAAAVREAAAKTQADADKSLQRANSRKEQAEKEQKGAKEALAKAEQAVSETRKARTNAENRYHQATLASRDGALHWLQVERDVVRTDFEMEQARSELQESEKATGEATRPIRAVAFSADNRLLSAAGDTGTVHTFDATDGTAFETYQHHSGPVTGLAFAASGDLISAGSDRTAIVWDIGSRWQIERRLGTGDADSPIADRVLALAFDPAGQVLASGGGRPSRDGQIHLWRVGDGKLLRELPEAHSDTVFSLQFSPDTQYLASGSADKFVKVFHAGDGQLTNTFEGHTHHVLDVSWHRNRKTLASSSADKTIKIWNFLDGSRIGSIAKFSKEVTALRHVGYSDELLISAGDPQVSIYQRDGEQVRAFDGPDSFMFCCDVTPDGRIVVAAGHNGVLYVWDGQGQSLATFQPTTDVKLAGLNPAP